MATGVLTQARAVFDSCTAVSPTRRHSTVGGCAWLSSERAALPTSRLHERRLNVLCGDRDHGDGHARMAACTR